MMKLKEINQDLRPRERLKKSGPESLSDAEVLSLILQNGTVGRNVLEISQDILSRYDLSELFEQPLKNLLNLPSIGYAKSSQIIAINEILKRTKLKKIEKNHFKDSSDVYSYARLIIGDKKEEHFMILHLNTQNRLIASIILSKGILDASIVHPREIFRSAIEHSAFSCIITHNHPSGDSSPSDADIEVTEKLIRCGKIIGIPIIDHVIIGKDNYYSFSDKKKT
jgi:DNA repair protein RadC